MKKIVLIGGGGHCKSVIDVARRMNCFDEMVITDPNIKKGTRVAGCIVVGGDSCLESLYREGFMYAFITIGSVKIDSRREMMADKVAALGYVFPIIQDPSAIVSSTSVIGDGSFIGKNAIINAESRVGNHCIVNTGAIIEHDCNVGDYTHVSVGTILCGGVGIGRNCFIGAGSTVIQSVLVDDCCIVGAGTVLINSLPRNKTAVGVPARII